VLLPWSWRLTRLNGTTSVVDIWLSPGGAACATSGITPTSSTMPRRSVAVLTDDAARLERKKSIA
jgi:hypothetical protein